MTSPAIPHQSYDALVLLHLVAHRLNVLLVMSCAAAAGWLFF